MREAVRAVVASPATWAVGAAGFLARGGILLFALPVWSLPTPVGVALLVPPLAVDTTGVAPGFLRELVALGVAIACLVALALVTGALADALAFAWLHRAGGDPAGVVRARRDIRMPDPPPDRTTEPGTPSLPAVVVRLVIVELVSLLPSLVAAVVTAGRLIAVGESEYLLPSSTSVPYVVRIVNGALPELVAFGACLLLADVVNAVLSRRLLRSTWDAGARDVVAAGTFGRSRRGGTHGRIARVAALVGAWAGGWIVTAVSVAPGLLAVDLAWPPVRDAYGATLGPTPPSPLELGAVTAVFVAAWVGGVLLAGLGSAFRTVGWTFATPA